MADLKYRVSIESTQAQAAINKLNGSINALSSSANTVSTAFKALLSGVAVTQLIQFADSITNVRNRLLQLSPTIEGANKQFQAIAGIAINARAPLESVSDLYFRIARAADTLGISQREAADITESVAKAITSSGLSAAEASGPLLQLGQALQSGRFQGDELRSILEGLPPVAKALADQLGVPIGALKELGAQGKISGQTFVDAMRAARDAIERDFAKTIPTITQAFTNLQTVLGIAFNQFENGTQTGQSLALAIEYLGFMIFRASKNIDAIIEPLGTIVKIVGGFVAFTVAGRIVSAFGSVLGGIVTSVLTLRSNLAQVVERVKDFGKILAAAGKTGEGFAGTILYTLAPLGRFVKAISAAVAGIGAFLGLDKVFDWFKSLGDSNSDSRKELEEYRKELAKFKDGIDQTAGTAPPPFIDPTKIAKAREEVVKIAEEYQRSLGDAQKRLELENSLVGATEQRRQMATALSDLEQGYLKTVNDLMIKYREASISGKEEDVAKLKEIEQQLQIVSEAYGKQIDVVRQLTEENFRLNEAYKQRQSLIDFTYKTEIDLAKKLRDLQHDIATSTMTAMEKKYADIVHAARESAQAAIDAENSRRRAAGIAKMTAVEEQKYRDAALRGTEQIIAAQRKADEESRKFSTGWKKAMREYIEEATNGAKKAESIFKKATQGMEDVIVNFAKTGKFEWKGFVASMLEELLRAQIKQIFAGLMTSMSNTMSQGGGILDAIGGLFGGGGQSQSGGGGGILDAIGGLFGGGAPGSSANNPLYVVPVGGGLGGGGIFGGGAGQPQGQGGGMLSTVWQGIKDVGSSIWEGAKTVGSGIWDAVSSIGSGLGNVVSSIGSGVGGFVSDIVGGIGDFFGGFFANGGNLAAGKFGVVGENGPEFISGPATITPMAGSNVTYNINAVDAMSFKQMLAQDPSFIYGLTMQGAKGIPARR